jgi:hypothetical protein
MLEIGHMQIQIRTVTTWLVSLAMVLSAHGQVSRGEVGFRKIVVDGTFR